MLDVCALIRGKKGVILERFKAEVKRLGFLPALPEPMLLDDFDELLDRLCRALEGESQQQTNEPAVKHARQRWEAGVDIGAIVREYGVLSIAIIGVLAEHGVALAPHEQIALASTVNRAAAVTVQQYALFRDEEYATQYKALRVIEAIRDALITDAPVGVAFLDRQLRFRLINEQLAKINGVPREQHIGRTPAEILPDIPAEFLMTQGKEVMTSGEPHRDLEVTGHTPAAPGVVRHWMEHWYPVRVGGDVIGVGVLVEEVTERKRQAEFRERLIGVVSHDLRNPLNSIVMSASLILMQPDTTETNRGFARRVLTSAKRMLGIVEQLFDYVSVDQGTGLPLSRAHLDLGELAARVAEETHLAFPDKPNVKVELEGDLEGEWDEARLGQVLSNLVGNALQHGEDSPVVALHGTNGVVHIDVTNHGKPIPPEKLESIFEPFKGSEQKQHLGLGLFISREIVRAHGGEIEATSGPNATVFSISLPREAGTAATA